MIYSGTLCSYDHRPPRWVRYCGALEGGFWCLPGASWRAAQDLRWYDENYVSRIRVCP